MKNFVFHIEPGDRLVGIMADGFFGWFEGEESWCEVENISPWKTQWYNEAGDKIERATVQNAWHVENMLKACVIAYKYRAFLLEI